MNVIGEEFVQKMGLDESYRDEYAQAVKCENAEDFKMSGEHYYRLGEIVHEEAKTWNDIAKDMEYDCCRSLITSLSSFYYGKAKDFFSKSFTFLCLYGSSKNDELSMNQLARCYFKGEYILPKNPLKAFSLLTQAAKGGHKPSMYELGKCYFEGLVIEKDLGEALKWFVCAAKKGDEAALNMVEQYCENDWGKFFFKKGDQKGDLSYLLANFYLYFKPNLNKAMFFLFNAVNMGSVEAMRLLANSYLYGTEPLTQDYSKAFSFYFRASKQGDAFSMQQIGCCYFDGFGTDKNYTEAFKWFECAASNGNTYSLVSLGDCYKNGTGTVQDHAKALNLYKQADEKGISEASCRLGNYYLDGIGIEKDQNHAISFYFKAAKQGSEEAMEALGNLYAKQINGLFKDEIYNVFVFFNEEADKGNAEAVYLLALCYQYGVGVVKDSSEAMLLCWEADKKGYKKATQKLRYWEKKLKRETDSLYWSGYLYKNCTTFVDHRLAAMNFLEAAKRGSARAMYQLGLLYESGDGVPKSGEEAIKWYQEAAKKNYSYALRKLSNQDSSFCPILTDKFNNEKVSKLSGKQEKQESLNETKIHHESLEKRAKIAEVKVLALLKHFEIETNRISEKIKFMSKDELINAFGKSEYIDHVDEILSRLEQF